MHYLLPYNRDNFIQHKEKSKKVETQLDTLRGHCSKIRDHIDILEAKAKRAGLKAGMLELFGLKSREQEQELLDALNKIHNDEMQFHANVWNMYRILEASLNDIGKALGPPGTMDAKNVPAAAELLGEYAEVFGKLESDANYAVLQLQEMINNLV